MVWLRCDWCRLPVRACSLQRSALVVFETSANAEISIDLDLRSPRPGFS
jgi:hypothetical protein